MTENVPQIEAGDPLSAALQSVLSSGARHLVVTQGGKLAGVLSDRDILRHQAEYGSAALDDPIQKAASMPAQFASPDDSLVEASARMAQRKVGCLPVIDKGKIVGMLTVTGALARDADRAMGVQERPSARRIMSRHPIVAHPSDELSVALDRMAANRVRHLPVIDPEGRLCGILSDRDLRGISTRGMLEELHVETVMTKNVISMPPEATLPMLVDAFTQWHLSALPIVDERRRPIGMVSYVDLLRALSE